MDQNVSFESFKEIKLIEQKNEKMSCYKFV